MGGWAGAAIQKQLVIYECYRSRKRRMSVSETKRIVLEAAFWSFQRHKYKLMLPTRRTCDKVGGDGRFVVRASSIFTSSFPPPSLLLLFLLSLLLFLIFVVEIFRGPMKSFASMTTTFAKNATHFPQQRIFQSEHRRTRLSATKIKNQNNK